VGFGLGFATIIDPVKVGIVAGVAGAVAAAVAWLLGRRRPKS
jgi:hypothetical protein